MDEQELKQLHKQLHKQVRLEKEMEEQFKMHKMLKCLKMAKDVLGEGHINLTHSNIVKVACAFYNK